MKVKTVYASQVACLDSNVHTGGGTDDTAALQAVLNEAGKDVGIHLIMDGAALVSGLTVYSNTTIECLNRDCGFFLMSGCREVITCGVLENPEFQVENVKLLGGTYNQDCRNQKRYNADHIIYEPGDYPYPGVNHHAHGPYGMAFYGVRHLLIDNVTIRNFMTYALVMDHFENVTIQDTWLDLPDHVDGQNQDGFHFFGPGRFLTIRNCGGRVGDDFMNIGPDERDRKASITDVLVDGIFLDHADQAIRLLARHEGSIERVTIRNVVGTYRSYGFYICPWYMDHHSGTIRDVLIENINLTAEKNNYDYQEPMLFCVAGIVENMTIQNITHRPLFDGRTLLKIGFPYYSMNEYHAYAELRRRQIIKGLTLQNVTITEAADAPADAEYITVYTKTDSLILKDITVLKEQTQSNGCLVKFKEEGSVDTLIAQQIFTKGLKEFTNAPEKIGALIEHAVVSK